MNDDDLLTSLKNTLGTAADRAPAPPPDLLDRVARRHRTRRRRTRAGAAATAMALVVGVSFFLVPSASEDAAPAAGASAPALAVDAKAVPVAKLWPQAVREIPARLPDGRAFHPLALLDENTLLISTESSFERTDRLLSYDIPAKRAKEITAVPTPAGATTFASDFTFGDGHVAWWLAHRKDGRAVVEIWAAPLTGGQARKVTSFDGGPQEGRGISRLAIGDGRVVWSMSELAPDAPKGVHQALLTGGEPTQIPGSDGYHLVAWPWIGSPAADLERQSDPQVVYKDLVNLRTGETRTARPRWAGAWSCGLTWCVGKDPQGRGYAQHRDGTHGRVLPARPAVGLPWDLPVFDRFLFSDGFRDVGPVLHDLHTGRTADLGIRPDKDGTLSFAAPDDPATNLYTVRGKNSFTLIDLSMVP